MTTYDLVRQFKGVTVWEFNQGNKDINLIRIGTKTHGICNTLSACWINYHAHNDSLANHLRQSGLNSREVLSLNHMIFLYDSFRKKTTTTAVTTWLKMHGMISLTSNTDVSAYADVEYRIVAALTKSYGCYAYIAFGVKDLVLNNNRIHAVSAWLGGSNYTEGDACFFEPNYGEFWFEKKQNFFDFFPVYLQLQRKILGISLCLPEDKETEYWEVSTFSLSNKAL